MSDDASKLFADMAEKLRREGFALGWRAAIEALGKAIAELPTPSGLEEVPAHSGGQPDSGGKRAGKMPKPGTIPYYMVVAVRKAPGGLTGGQIVDAVRAEAPGATEASIRTNIQRTKKRKLIVLRHGKWFPA